MALSPGLVLEVAQRMRHFNRHQDSRARETPGGRHPHFSFSNNPMGQPRSKSPLQVLELGRGGGGVGGAGRVVHQGSSCWGQSPP